MLKWLATKFEAHRGVLQSRLENSLQPASQSTPSADSQEWRKRGNAHLNEGRLEEAAQCYRRGIEANPEDGVCYSNLGYVLGELGRQAESEEMLLKSVALNPTDFDAHYMLGNIARAREDWSQAIASYRVALRINALFDNCRRDLCVALAHVGQPGEARVVLGQGPAFAPGTVDYYYFRGTLDFAEDLVDDALENFQRAAQLQPHNTSILINLGAVQVKKRDVFSAIATYRTVLQLEPNNVQAHSNMAAAFQLSGQQDLAAQSYRQALQINPEYLYAHQNLLYLLTSAPDFSPAEYLVEGRKYGKRISGRAKPYSQWLCPALTEARPLRVGFVSGDLHSHPVGMFLQTVLAHLDPRKLTLIAYSSGATEDDVSERLKPFFSAWNQVAAMADEDLAKKIHGDQVDILVDLSGHTALNRLPVFAWKPAPLQVSWLGYWATTGVAEMDYILVDPVSVPQSEARYFSEKLWYLPDTRLCFSPPITAQPVEITSLPAQSKGHLTFGSYQALNKINDRTLAAWSRILAEVPAARLRIQSRPLTYPDAIADVRKRLAAAQIDIARVDLFGGVSRDRYLTSYADVDVVLDTFPFPGGTTTAEALWMGVPTVTLGGNSLLARQGESMMRCVGLADWVAHDEDEYVKVALAQVRDLNKLGELRASLRSRALDSPLFDARKFAKNLEGAFAAMARSRAER